MLFRSAGLVYGDSSRAFIFLNRDDPFARRRFSLAHEIGHFMLHGGGALARATARPGPVPLDDEPEVLRQRLPRNWHNRLNAAEASALKVERVGNKPAQYQWLLDREQALQQQRGYRALPKTFIPAYQAACKASPDRDVVNQDAVNKDAVNKHDANKADALFTLRADLDRTPVAGMMFLRHGDAATYHVGWSDAAQRLPGAHNLLLWQAMLQLRQAGVRRIDLGGVNTGRSAGVARFKIGKIGRAHV